jgi:nucleotide-binding universal stress UspA family protein
MKTVYACIDGLSTHNATVDWAAWSAMRLQAPLELLHVLERPAHPAPLADYSGTIGLGAHESILNELSALDERRGALLQEAGRRLLAAARARATTAGVTQLDTRLRHGELVDSVLELEPQTRLLVLGQHVHAHPTGKVHLDHHVERVIRATHRPILVTTNAPFEAPRQVVIAFDGSPTARKMVDTVATSPLFQGLPMVLVTAGAAISNSQVQLTQAQHILTAAGFSATVKNLSGDPEEAITDYLKDCGSALLVIGAYGHSRIRQLIVGSTTSTLLRLSTVPVLVMR